MSKPATHMPEHATNMPEHATTDSDARNTVSSLADARIRTYTWNDPNIIARSARHLSGMEFLQAMGRGNIAAPPIFATLGMDLTHFEVEHGRVAMPFLAREYHYNPIGSVHGGVITTLLDTVVACAVHSTLPVGSGYTTLEIKVNFTRAVQANSGILRCEGKVITIGRTIGTAEGRLTDNQGRICAYATTTCLIFPYPPQPAERVLDKKDQEQ